MTSLRETLESLQLLCWNATEDNFDNKIQDYLKAYPHLRSPASVDLLHQTISLWFEIKNLEERLKTSEKESKHDKLVNRILRLQKQWIQMLGNLGISFTRVQYKAKKRVVQPPIERLKMIQKKKKSGSQ